MNSNDGSILRFFPPPFHPSPSPNVSGSSTIPHHLVALTRQRPPGRWTSLGSCPTPWSPPAPSRCCTSPLRSKSGHPAGRRRRRGVDTGYRSLMGALRRMFVDMDATDVEDDELLDLSNAVSGHIVAYEDMEDDLLLVGDLNLRGRPPAHGLRSGNKKRKTTSDLAPGATTAQVRLHPHLLLPFATQGTSLYAGPPPARRWRGARRA
jgi:hypothetical protein